MFAYYENGIYLYVYERILYARYFRYGRFERSRDTPCVRDGVRSILSVPIALWRLGRTTTKKQEAYGHTGEAVWDHAAISRNS